MRSNNHWQMPPGIVPGGIEQPASCPTWPRGLPLGRGPKLYPACVRVCDGRLRGSLQQRLVGTLLLNHTDGRVFYCLALASTEAASNMHEAPAIPQTRLETPPLARPCSHVSGSDVPIHCKLPLELQLAWRERGRAALISLTLRRGLS